MHALTDMLTEHFSWNEVVHSDEAIENGIDNTPPASMELVLENTAECMERVRAALSNKPIDVSSWYRCAAVNTLVRSNNLTSQHPRGEAVDFTCSSYGNPLAICKQLISLHELIRFDQLILEHSWVHISFTLSGTKPRNQVLSLLETGGYAQGLTDKKGIRL